MKISNEKGVKLMSVPRLLVKVRSEIPLPGSRDVSTVCLNWPQNYLRNYCRNSFYCSPEIVNYF